MNIPFVLDVAIGLIFIYLILSLLASEIQELLATLLQWRAKHLKISIEELLAGGSGNVPDEELIKVRELANELYSAPLINSLNHEARGPLVDLLRSLTKYIDVFYRKIYCLFTKSAAPIFGNRNSAPSYINSETFAISLIEALKITELIQQATILNLGRFQEDIVGQIDVCFTPLLNDTNLDAGVRLHLAEEINELRNKFQDICDDFTNNKVSLSYSIKRMQEKIDKYIENSQDFLPEGEKYKIFIARVKYLRKNTFSNAKEAILLAGLQPNLTKVLEDYGDIIKAVRERGSYNYQRIHKKYGQVENIIEYKLVEKLPESVINNLSFLAKRSITKIDDIENGINQFQKEIETWFDRSMERASGVYKRNSKGVALLIGLAIAGFTNADTFHIVSRLSKNSELRSAIAESAIQVAKEPQDIATIKNQVNQQLEDVSLPLGWSSANLRQQEDESKRWQLYGVNFGYLKRPVGWILSAIALAMGAPFWFDLLNKFVNVRNTGKKPDSSDKA